MNQILKRFAVWIEFPLLPISLTEVKINDYIPGNRRKLNIEGNVYFINQNIIPKLRDSFVSHIKFYDKDLEGYTSASIARVLFSPEQNIDSSVNS